MNSWRKHVPWALVAVAFFIFVATVGMVGILSSGGDAVGLIKIKGRISDSRAAIQQLHRLNDNPLVKALVIDLDCPGCPLASAQSLFEEIKKIQRQGKPVLVAVDQICLGGGYYLACGAKCIFANPGSLTCIINESPSLSPELSAELRDQFINAVLDARGEKLAQALALEKKMVITDLFPQDVKIHLAALADGRYFSGRQAFQLGLVDVLGNLDDAVDEAAKMAGLKGRLRVVTIKDLPVSTRLPGYDRDKN